MTIGLCQHQMCVCVVYLCLPVSVNDEKKRTITWILLCGKKKPLIAEQIKSVISTMMITMSNDELLINSMNMEQKEDIPKEPSSIGNRNQCK